MTPYPPPTRRTTEALALILVAAAFLAAAATAARAQGGQAPAAVIAEMETSTRQPYAGEVFEVDLAIGLTRGRRGEIVGAPSWDHPDLVAEPFGDGVQADLRGHAAVRRTARVLAPRPGAVELPPLRQQVRVESARQRVDPFERLRGGMLGDFDRLLDDSLFDSFFERTNLEQVAVQSNGGSIHARALPEPAPAGFTGAVGQFVLESKIVPEEARAGEPVTWTLTLRGTGNWPGGVSLPPRAVPVDFRTLQPKQQRRFTDGSLFTGEVSEDLVLIPSRPGTHTLAAVRFTYFDPRAEEYRTAVVEPPTLVVGGSPLVAAGAAPGASMHSGETDPRTAPPSGPPSSALAHATSPESPPSPVDARLPREPRAGVGVALPPLSSRTMAALLAVPLALLSGYALFLAAHRAWSADARRCRRQALRALRGAIEEVRNASDADGRRAALLAWQHAATVLLGIDFAAPTPAHLRRLGVIGSEWIALWSESDAALYGREGSLADDWHGRARALGRGLGHPVRATLPRLWPARALPATAAAALLAALVVPAHADPIADYARGDFFAARQVWRAAAEAEPSDWVARYNLGLAEAQTGADSGALAETTAAFLHRPSDADVRWNLGVFAARVPGLDPILARFANGASAVKLASLLSPACWQLLLFAATCVCCLAAGATLRRRSQSLACAPAWLALFGSGAMLALASWASLHQYEHLAHPAAALVTREAVVRSVPTDAESTQAAKTIAPGAVVVVRRDFLGWSKVTLPSGEIGWVRGEALAPLYGSPA